MANILNLWNLSKASLSLVGRKMSILHRVCLF